MKRKEKLNKNLLIIFINNQLTLAKHYQAKIRKH